MSSFFKSSGTSVTIQNTIDTLITDAQAAKTAAETAASNSSTSAGLSSTSANNASSSATDAASSLTSSQTAQAAAETAETNAETAQTASETAATNSANSASTASTQASNASTSATNASNSASTATTKASEASTSATNAATSATNSANSATASSGSASTASTQASNASTSASNASTSATNASTSASTATTKASEASTSATNAASSASTASTQATNASNSASTASTQATNASNSATAASTSATNAASSASTAQTLSTSFNNIYLGALSSAPSQDPDGSALDEGDLYYDTTQGELKVYKSSGWAAAGSTVNGTSARYHYDITGAVTSVTGADAAGNTLAYDAGYVDVYVNGVRMSTADVTTTSGNAIVFAEALASGDDVDIVGYGTFVVANMNADNLDSGTVPDARITGAYTGITNLTATGVGSFGSLDISGDIDVDGVTNLDVVDIDGAVDMASTLLVAGNVTMQGATTNIGSGAGGTNFQLNLNGVGSKATRIHFREGVTDRWLLGQGAASETSDFELFNATGVIALKVNRSTNLVTVANGLTLTDGNLVVANGHGIDFGATGNVSGTSSEFLDDYEEGVAYVAFTSSGASFNYSVRKCTYTKVGRIVHIQIYMQLDGTQTLTGNAVTITGLPFTSSNLSNYVTASIAGVRYVNFDSPYTYLQARVGTNTTTLNLIQNGAGQPGVNLNSNDLSNASGQIFINMSYITA